jgi:NitT/TauT family transport system ATP-binding protein
VLSERPTKVLEIVEVDLPRPRNLDMMVSPRFGEYTRGIRSLFQLKGGLD